MRRALACAAAVLGLTAFSGCRFALAVRRAKKLACASTFEPLHRAPDATRRILVVGDSTAVGIGAGSTSETLAGVLVAQFPSTAIENHACLGARMQDMVPQIDAAEDASYDVVLMSVGGNDIIRGTPRHLFRDALDEAIRKALALSRVVIVLNSPNVGAAPLFPWPLTILLSRRSLRIRLTFEEVCAAHPVEFVNFTFEPALDPFRRQRSVYFAADGLHPTAAAYAYCVEHLKRATRLITALS